MKRMRKRGWEETEEEINEENEKERLGRRDKEQPLCLLVLSPEGNHGPNGGQNLLSHRSGRGVCTLLSGRERRHNLETGQHEATSLYTNTSKTKDLL